MSEKESPAKSLHDSCAMEILKKKGSLNAGTCVRVPGYPFELYLVGFISYTERLSSKILSVDLNSHLYVTPYYIRIGTINEQHPIFSHIRVAQKKSYILTDKVYVNPLIDRIGDIYGYSTGYLKGSLLTQNTNFVIKGFVQQSEDGVCRYTAQDNEIELTSDYLDILSIATGFLCLCRYINPVTGLPSYTLVTSNDAIIVKPKGADD